MMAVLWLILCGSLLPPVDRNLNGLTYLKSRKAARFMSSEGYGQNVIVMLRESTAPAMMSWPRSLKSWRTEP